MMSTSTFLFCCHCFCFGGVFFGYFNEERKTVVAAFFTWLLLTFATITRWLVLL